MPIMENSIDSSKNGINIHSLIPFVGIYEKEMKAGFKETDVLSCSSQHYSK